MRVQSLLILSFFLFFRPAFAAHRADSVGVENTNGKQVILYKIGPKETYYQLGRKYNVPVQKIIDFNSSRALQPGIIVKVPTDRPFGGIAPLVIAATPADTVIEYKVGKGESLFAIARRFGTTVNEIKALNNLRSNALALGQILKVKQGAAQPVSQPVAGTTSRPPVQERATPPVTPPERQPVVVAPPDTAGTITNVDADPRPGRYGLRQHEEKGVAIWIADENVDGTKMLALHNIVPAGTIIKATNPMNGKSTFVKVIGKYTENESTKDVIVVFTKAVADLIGALDKRFQVSITYGVPSEN